MGALFVSKVLAKIIGQQHVAVAVGGLHEEQMAPVRGGAEVTGVQPEVHRRQLSLSDGTHHYAKFNFK
jgi:hypothetical protein